MIFTFASLSTIVDNLIYSALVVFVSIFLVITINALLPYTKRYTKGILWKSVLIASGISYGIWVTQIFTLGLILNIFISMVLHVILIGMILFITWIFARRFVKRTIEISLVDLEERLLEKAKYQEQLEARVKQEKVLLDVQDLVTYFYTEEGIVRAVEGVSFQILENEVLGLVGETGCGKSVTALSILQLVRPPGKIMSGKVEFLGINLLDKTAEEMRDFRGNQITMIFQDPLNALNPVMKVGEQLVEVYLNHKMDELYAESGKSSLEYEEKNKKLNEIIKFLKESQINYSTSLEGNHKNVGSNEEKIQGLLNQKHKLEGELSDLNQKTNIFLIARKWAANIIKDVGIPDPEQILFRYPHELSGGMRQRIMIAMGLACSPKLLIADEPTTALDVTIQAQILELMKKLQVEYRTSILMITHDLGLISELCDRVAVMYSGYIVEYGSIFKLFKNPLHPYTRGLITAIPRVEKRVENLQIIPGMVPNLIYPPSGCRFHPRCEYCFEPCVRINPKQIEVEPGYFVACHLYDHRYKDIVQRVLDNPKKIEQEMI